jgi:hypothetical protein
MNERIAAALSGAVHVALSPLTLAGYALWAGRAIAHERRSNASGRLRARSRHVTFSMSSARGLTTPRRR